MNKESLLMSNSQKENMQEPASHENKDRETKQTEKRCTKPAQQLYVPKHMRNKPDEKTCSNDQSGLKNVFTNGTQHNEAATDSAKPAGLIEFNDPSIIGYIAEKKSTRNDENQILKDLGALSLTCTSTECKIDSKIKLLDKNGTNKNKPVKSGDWFDMYDDLGEIVNKNEVPKNCAEAAVVEEGKKIDYYKWEPREVDSLEEEEYAHIIEIYECPIEFKNENIFGAFREVLGNQEFDLKWVDDTHCIGVFPNAVLAANALKLNSSFFIKTRPISKASAESRRKAQRLVNYLKPYKPRPQTTSFVASKLISASLGMRSLIPKEKLKIEKNKLDTAREKKYKEKELKEAVWNGL